MKFSSCCKKLQLLLMSQPNQQLIAQLKQSFMMFDVNGDGVITTEELKLVLKKFGVNASQDEIQNMIKQLDKDGNGTVQLNEYIDVMVSNTIGRPQQVDENSEMMATFRLFDKNNDGLISALELKQGLQILGDKGDPIKEEDIKQLLDAADIDGDGYINYDEFVRMLKFK